VSPAKATRSAFTRDALDAAWEKALEVWGLAIRLSPPQEDPSSPAIAYIDLTTRQVVINPQKIASLKAEGSIEAILAHELGHHLRFPASLAVQARLELLERELLPIRGYSLLNLFTDFLINTELARETPHLMPQLAAVYLGCPAGSDDGLADPVFYFYLTCFEEAWLMPPRTLTRDAGTFLEGKYAGLRAEAQQLAETIPNLAPNIFTQFVYFASVVSRFQQDSADPSSKSGEKTRNPSHGDHSSPSPGDYADALKRSAQESDAIKRAIKEGWLKPGEIPDAQTSEARRAGALPGVLAGQPKKLAEVMAIQYRRLAEKYLFKPPMDKQGGDPFIPSTLSPWEVGDSPKDIDWISTITASGPDLAVVSPLKRDLLEDDPEEKPRVWTRRLEIYLDVSGSMPDPKSAVNPMTLAAQVLAMSAIRNGGQVRGLIYSTNNMQHWEWTRSEMEMSRFLMNYIGGGTDFPFDVLAASVRDNERRQPVRVVLTDSDFNYNLHGRKEAPAVCTSAAQGSPFLALLNGTRGGEEWVKSIAALGIRTVPVPDLASFPKVAAVLGEELFGESARKGGRI
jgi:hypothetical protein